MIFDKVAPKPEDPIDVISRMLKSDQNPEKVDLGIGVYRNEAGESPVMRAVVEAEKRVVERGDSKEYLTPAGNLRYCELVEPLFFGEGHNRSLISLQTPGGGPAIRAGAELIKRLSPSGRIWTPEPTWGHQLLVFKAAGLSIVDYPYYNVENSAFQFQEMMDTIEREAKEGDAVLLHGCCHNPTGQDLDESQWRDVADMVTRKHLIPFIDIAYLGFGRGLEADNIGVRVLAEKAPEMVVASTSSKSFAIYRERAGMITLVSDLNEDRKTNLRKEVLEVTRGLYFMSADHGAAIVAEILGDSELTRIWKTELASIHSRIVRLRESMSEALNQAFQSDRFSYINQQFGMFSLLPLSPDQISQLAEGYSVYLIPDGRINIAGLAEKGIQRVAESIRAVS